MPHYGLELLAEPLERIIQTIVEHDHSEDTAEGGFLLGWRDIRDPSHQPTPDRVGAGEIVLPLAERHRISTELFTC